MPFVTPLCIDGSPTPLPRTTHPRPIHPLDPRDHVHRRASLGTPTPRLPPSLPRHFPLEFVRRLERFGLFEAERRAEREETGDGGKEAELTAGGAADVVGGGGLGGFVSGVGYRVGGSGGAQGPAELVFARDDGAEGEGPAGWGRDVEGGD